MNTPNIEFHDSVVKNLASQFSGTITRNYVTISKVLSFQLDNETGEDMKSTFPIHDHPRWTTCEGILRHFEEIEEIGLQIYPLDRSGYRYLKTNGSFGRIYASDSSIIKITDHHSSFRCMKNQKSRTKLRPLTTLPAEATLQFLAWQILPNHVLPITVCYEFDGIDRERASIMIQMRRVSLWMDLRKGLDQRVILSTAFELYEQISAALCRLHCDNIFHRDIKIDNLGYLDEVVRTSVILDWGRGTCPLTESRGYSFSGEDGDSRYWIPTGCDKTRDLAGLDISLLVFLHGESIRRELFKSIQTVRKEMMCKVEEEFRGLRKSILSASNTISTTTEEFLQQLKRRLISYNAI